MAPNREISAGSILRELILNQYQAIVAGGATLASVLTLSPLPLLLWLGAELVLLPILDSGPLRRLVAKRRREAARAESRERRSQIIASFEPVHRKRYEALEQLCRMIETNYQSLTGISQAYLSEQRGKLDDVLDGCLHRMLALQRYERMPSSRRPADIEREITALQEELEQPQLNDRARAALEKNLELKKKLLASYSEVGATMKALSTELDSMASLLEVLHQNSLSLRDPHAISEELDTLVRQSEDSDRVVREMEALLRSEATAWGADAAAGGSLQTSAAGPAPAPRQRTRNR